MRFLITALTLALSTGVQASDLSATFGEEHLGVHYSRDVNQLKLSADLLYNFDDEETVANIGLGKNILLGNNTLTLGAKANVFDLAGHDTEFALSFGGEVDLPLNDKFALYGSAYWAPEFASSGRLTNYVDSSVGVRFNVTKPLSLDLGYRFSQAEFNGRHTHTIADGLYGGVGFKF